MPSDWIVSNISSSTVGSTIWNHWTAGTSSSITIQSVPVLSSWIDRRVHQSTVSTYAVWRRWSETSVTQQIMPEEQARQAMRQADQARIQTEQSAAKERAEKILVENLSPQQHECLKANGYFFVDVGDRRYRIDRGRTRNVRLVDSAGKVMRNLCAHPLDNVPDADTMLAQKLQLETDEDSFLKIANVS